MSFGFTIWDLFNYHKSIGKLKTNKQKIKFKHNLKY